MGAARVIINGKTLDEFVSDYGNGKTGEMISIQSVHTAVREAGCDIGRSTVGNALKRMAERLGWKDFNNGSYLVPANAGTRTETGRAKVAGTFAASYAVGVDILVTVISVQGDIMLVRDDSTGELLKIQRFKLA